MRGCWQGKAVPPHALAGILVAMSAVFSSCGGGGTATLKQGPLECRDCPTVGVASSVDPGKPFTYGLLLLNNSGPRAATVVSVTLLRASSGLRMVGAYVMDPRDPRLPRRSRGMIGTDNRRFPPLGVSAALESLRGTVVGRRPLEVLIGLRVPRDGFFVFKGLAVNYSVDRTSYRATYPLLLKVCAPKSRWLGRCEWS